MSQNINIQQNTSQTIISNPPPSIIEKISNNKNFPLEDFLNDVDVISAIESEDKKIKRYLDSEKIKKLIIYITKEPKDNNYLNGYKYPYISHEILKMNCNFISKRFILNEEEYYKEFFYIEDILERLEKRVSTLELKLSKNNNDNDKKKTNDINLNLDKEETKNENKELIKKEIKPKNPELNKDKDRPENMENNPVNNYHEESKNKVETRLDTKEKKEETDNANKNENKIDKDNNEYLDLLLDFVDNDKPELNYILSGYFSEVMLNLIKNYPYQIYKYIYNKKKDKLKKILFLSHQKSFESLSEKLFNLESLNNILFIDKKLIQDLITENKNYKNELLKELLLSINLEGLKLDKVNITNVENIFLLIIELIKGKTSAIEIINNKELSYHICNILDTNLYDEKEKNRNNFSLNYNIYCLFINFVSESLKIINKYSPKYCPSTEDFERIKNKKCIIFKDYIINSFENILKYNFRPRGDNITNNSLGILNVYIVEFVINMFNFMVHITKEFDNILISNKFCEKSLEYFFKYQWNNIYHNKFLEFFWLYLTNEINHKELTNLFFNKIKLQNLLCDFLENKNTENAYNIIIPNIKYELISGNKIKSGIYSHIIYLVYKIQTYSGLEVFNENEIKNMNIRHLGEFKFLRVNNSFSLFNSNHNKISISMNLKTILSIDKRWDIMFRNIAFPVIKKYELQLFKKEFNRLINSKMITKNNNINNNLNYSPKRIDEEKENINTKEKANNIINNNAVNITNNNTNDKKNEITINKDIIKIDNNYNDVNYWKINMHFEIKNNNNCKEEDEENELLNIAINLEKKEIIDSQKKVEQNTNKENNHENINNNTNDNKNVIDYNKKQKENKEISLFNKELKNNPTKNNEDISIKDNKANIIIYTNNKKNSYNYNIIRNEKQIKDNNFQKIIWDLRDYCIVCSIFWIILGLLGLLGFFDILEK